MLLCPEKADLCLITRLNMTRVLECVLQLLANEHTSPFLRVVRTACPGWRGSVQLAGQPAASDGINVVTAPDKTIHHISTLYAS